MITELQKRFEADAYKQKMNYAGAAGIAAEQGFLAGMDRCLHLLQQTQCTTLLEFEKPMMNVATLEAKMKKFFDTVTSDELIERFENLGYELKQIDEPPIA